jgi:hypothetical protein
MKVSPEDLQTIRDGLTEARRSLDIQSLDFSSVRMMWELFHYAVAHGLIDQNDLYARYDDNHIETALKTIFKHRA